MQIVQELCKRPGLNKAGFEMLTIYIPTLQEKVDLILISFSVELIFFKKTRCVNQIEDVCKQIEKTIKQTIQNTLNSLEKDSDQIINRINDKIKIDK